MVLHLDCSILGISSYNDSDGSKNSTYKDGAVAFDYSNSLDLLNVGEYSCELIDFLENAHKFIKRTKNSSPSDYNLTRESLISLSACLCLLYLASDHFTGFTNSNPTTPYQEKIGSFSFFQGNSWKRRRKTNRWPILAAERTVKTSHWAKAAHWRCTFNLQSKHSSTNIHKCFLMFLMKIPTLLTA